MAETKEFDVVRVARSDGADTGPGYWPVAAAPTASNLRKSGKDAAVAPRAKAQMLRLDDDDPRFVEWRIKLGILLKQELSLNPEGTIRPPPAMLMTLDDADMRDTEGNPWYVHFPRGYWLYEKSKHLWVSGYPIKAKLFKTPQEFGLHLIWLLSASMDYEDCCCVHCNAPRIPPVPDGGSIAFLAMTTSNKATPVALPAVHGQPPPPLATSETSSQVPAQATPTATAKPADAVPAGTGATAQGPLQDAAAQSQAAQQAPPAQAQPQTQREHEAAFEWALQAPFLFRAGEMVWYQNGNSWRLGIIAGPGNESFQLIPIGHAAAQQANVTKTAKEMRPFHAFSVPGVMLPDVQNKVFDQVSWENLFRLAGQDRVKRTNLILDSSKMAASKIDASYSLWCPLAEDVNAETVPYYGCFFGAERIEVGDCVRVKPLPGDKGLTSESSVLGLRAIVARRGSPGDVLFRGNVYQIVKPGKDRSADVVSLEDLPLALRDEMQWRHRVNPNQPWRWVLVKADVVLEEQAVRGRFYPTHRLMPILNEAAFNAAVAEGNLESQYPFLNNRMDGSGGYIGLKASRREMLGTSVPDDAIITLEPLIREMGRAAVD